MAGDHTFAEPADTVERRLIDLVPDLVAVCRDGVLAVVNRAGAVLLGAAEPSDLTGRPFLAMIDAPDRTAAAGRLAGSSGARAVRLRRLDGSAVNVSLLATALPDGAVALHARDLTHRMDAAAALRDPTLAARVFETTLEGILVLDATRRVTAANPAASEITGYRAADLMGAMPPFLAARIIGAETSRLLWDTAAATGRWQGELWSVRKDERPFAARFGVSAVPGGDGRPSQFVVTFSDITRSKTDEDRIRRQATYDQLTNLPNRSLFLDRLGQAVHLADRSGQMVGLMFIDLDGFKLVNDTLGHHVGDMLLQETGRRLLLCVRAGDTVARLGGDEFTVLMPNLGNYRNAPRVAQRILDSLRKPFDLGGKEAFVSGSIGITVFPDDADSAETMLKNADAAMYRAKEMGKANYQFFTSDMNDAVAERLTIKNGLSKALERNELMLWFQPKLDLASGTVTGVEGLLRWQAAELGMVSPAKFIPVMEETGLIGQVGEWVLTAASRQYRAWAKEGLGHLRVAVNLSVRQLRQPGFVAMVERVLAEAGIPADGIELEITESMIMNDTEHAIATLKRLSAMGIKLAMDDFGTGYSSLSYLKRFPVDSIKIDRSFISNIATDTDDHEIIRTIITMGHSLRRRIVAEGVETREQAAILKRLGCDEIQGYLLSPPVPAQEIKTMIKGPLAHSIL
ncbi:MAG: EAL domain-containing protein [Magnetospirillum sp.]|nr:EAL domain-containing protein [Magnetospirillum sp.]